MDPVAGLGLFKAIADAGKAISEIAKSVSDREIKQELNRVYDTLISLKQDAASLEDENRELKEKLRFRADDFDFRNPFYYEENFPERPLCPKCFAAEKVAPMSVAKIGGVRQYRDCLVCGKVVYL